MTDPILTHTPHLPQSFPTSPDILALINTLAEQVQQR
jgi:hypothetical protein